MEVLVSNKVWSWISSHSYTYAYCTCIRKCINVGGWGGGWVRFQEDAQINKTVNCNSLVNQSSSTIFIFHFGTVCSPPFLLITSSFLYVNCHFLFFLSTSSLVSVIWPTWREEPTLETDVMCMLGIYVGTQFRAVCSHNTAEPKTATHRPFVNDLYSEVI